MPSQLPIPISQLLSGHFGTLAETPDAVEKLRAFVLELAEVPGRKAFEHLMTVLTMEAERLEREQWPSMKR